ncbi:MAG: ATP12 family chaperone protein [Rhodospirillaceae bacterium]
MIDAPSGQADKSLSMQRRKRIYKTVEVATVDAPVSGFAVMLDGRPARTPGKRPVICPSEALASAVAKEWDAQEKEIHPETMPLSALVNTALDGVSDRAEEVRAELVRYGGSDLLCYRAADPEDLVARQAAAWQPVLNWFEGRYGIPLQVTSGLMPITQAPEALDALARVLAAIDPWPLTTLQVVTGAAGSVVLALALYEGHLGGAEVTALSMLDETFQAEKWGEDAEAMARRANVAADILCAEQMLALIRQP